MVKAAVSYEWGDWRVGLNLNNLTDEEYVDAAWGGLSRSVHPGAPVEAVLSVSYRVR